MAEKRQFLRFAKKLCATFVALFAFAIAPAHAILPSGYTELEYIEALSRGPGFVDNLLITNTQKIEIDLDISDNLTDQIWIAGHGASTWEDQTTMRYNSDVRLILQAGGRAASLIPSTDTRNARTLYTMDILNHKSYVNGVQVLDFTGYPFNPNGKWGYMGYSSVGDSDSLVSATEGKLYSIKVWDNNVLIRNFIPVRRDSDDVLGIYDVVSNTFLTNAGSGTFTAGPAKCRNLFDKNNTNTADGYIANAYLNSNGAEVSNNIYAISVYIPVEGNTNYYYSINGTDGQTLSGHSAPRVAYYDANKVYISSSNALSSGASFQTPVNCKYIRVPIYKAALEHGIQLEQGTTATDYVPYCVAEIKIATTSYNDAAFAPVEQALESAVTTIKDVVANTIVQADAIQNLQDTKQTMPDASGTNGTCPRFRQCLLIETDDGTPQWFPIIDPFKDFITPILANNDHITPVDAQRRFYGDDDLCRMLPQTDDEATNTGIAKCTEVANAKNTATDNPEKGNLKQTEWGYEFKAADIGANPATDNPNNDEGIVYGISKCVSTDVPAGTYAQPATSTQLNNALWNARPTTMAGAGKYRRCWCKATSVAYGGQYYETSNAPWVFYDTYGSAASCVYACTADCASLVRNRADFRSAVLGWAVE